MAQLLNERNKKIERRTQIFMMVMMGYDKIMIKQK